MGFFNQFPWSNMHGFNLDWIINKIKANETSITQNASDIAQNASDIAQNASDIVQNASDIAQNASDIAQNASDIVDNTAEIDFLKGAYPGVIPTYDGMNTVVGVVETPLTLKREMALEPPEDFTWQLNPLNGELFTDGEGNFVTTFDVADIAPSGKTYYVDVNTGSDSNDGLSWGTALKSIHTAGKKADAVVIQVAAGVYNDSNAMNNWTIDKNLSIIGNGDVIVSTNRSLVGAWTINPTYANVYEAPRTLIKRVLDKSVLDVSGDYLEVTEVGSVSEVEQTPNSYYYDGSNIYLRTHNDRLPDADILTLLDLNNLYANTNVIVYLENLKVEGGKYCVNGDNQGNGTPVFYAKDSSFKYAFFDDGCGHFGSDAIYQNCVAARNRNDGFSYNPRNGLSKAIEINCISRDNGDEGGNDNGTTSHDGCSVIRVNGCYNSNVGPNLADVGGSESWNMGCVIAESKGGSEAANRGVTSSRNNALDNTRIWLDGCHVFGNTHDVYNDDLNFIYQRNTKYGTFNKLPYIY